MSIEIKAPQFPESVADGTVATWHKQEGDRVNRDELLVDIETDKVVLEVVSPADGVLKKIHHGELELKMIKEERVIHNSALIPCYRLVGTAPLPSLLSPTGTGFSLEAGDTTASW